MDAIALSLTLVAFGVLLIMLSYQRHRHHRDLSALAHGISGALMAIGGLAWLTLTLNFNTYEPLTPDQPLAELTLERAGPNSFNARLLRIPAGDLQVFVLQGDRWRMAATLLEWHDWTEWLGLRANLRLENLSSSLASAPKGNFLLNRTPGVALVTLQRRYPEALDFMTSRVVQTAFMPLQDGLRFHVYFSGGELLARPINQAKVAKPSPPAHKPPTLPHQGEARDAGDPAAGQEP